MCGLYWRGSSIASVVTGEHPLTTRVAPRTRTPPRCPDVMADDHLPPPPTLPLLFHHGLLPYLLLTTALAIPHRPRLVAAIFLPLLWASYHRLLQSTSPSPPAGFALGAFVVFHAAFSLDLLLLRNPRHEFTRAPHAQPYPLTSLPQRLVWAIDLATGMRGIGWNWAARPVPRETATALRGFLATRLRRLLLLWAWLDASVFWMQQVDAAFFLPPGNTYHVPGSSQGAVYTSLFAASSRPQVLALPKGFPALPDSAVGSAAYRAALHLFRTLLQGAVVYAAIDGAYTALALVFCCIGGLTRGRGGRWLDWRYWPDVFAAWSDGWGDGLTGCWGRAWHGLFKYVCLPHPPPAYLPITNSRLHLDLHLALALPNPRAAPPARLPCYRSPQAVHPLRHVRATALQRQPHTRRLDGLGQRALLPPAAARDPARAGAAARVPARTVARLGARGGVCVVRVGGRVGGGHQRLAVRGRALQRHVGVAAGAGECVARRGGRGRGVVGVEAGYGDGVAAVVGVGSQLGGVGG